jgi:hypothetical protein
VTKRVKLAFVDHFVYAYLAGRPGALSGAERQLWLLGRALASQGWTVVFGVDHGLTPGERHRFQGVEFVGIGGGADAPSTGTASWRRSDPTGPIGGERIICLALRSNWQSAPARVRSSRRRSIGTSSPAALSACGRDCGRSTHGLWHERIAFRAARRPDGEPAATVESESAHCLQHRRHYRHPQTPS